jgi:nucleotide-binding universal stress UspA family protein
MKIVVAYDNRDEGRAALEWAIEEAKRHDAEIIVVGSLRGTGGSDAVVQQVLPYRRELDEVERRLTAAGIRHEIKRYVRGQSFAEDVMEDASGRAADMIVIGLRPRSRAGNLFLRSRSRAILLGAECPVLAVKAKD